MTTKQEDQISVKMSLKDRFNTAMSISQAKRKANLYKNFLLG